MFGVAATSNPQVAIEVLEKLKPERDDHQQYAGAAVAGLLKSNLPQSAKFGIVTTLDARGFRSDDFRETVANALHDAVKLDLRLPDQVVHLLIKVVG